jgi:hypothetical protein
MLRERQEIGRDDLYNLCSVFWLAVLDDVLRNVVAVLVCDQHRSALVEFF